MRRPLHAAHLCSLCGAEHSFILTNVRTDRNAQGLGTTAEPDDQPGAGSRHGTGVVKGWHAPTALHTACAATMPAIQQVHICICTNFPVIISNACLIRRLRSMLAGS